MSVPYHHPDDDYLSIEFVNPNLDTVQQEAEKRADEATEILSFDLDRAVHVLYAGTKPPGSADEIEQDLSELVTGMSETDEIVTTRALGAFERILSEKEIDEGEKLRAYKGIEAAEIPTALDRVDWNGAVVEVGGEILSNLILRHPFPNANHRTALVVLERYAYAHEYGFDIPKMHTTNYEWKPWANEYIRQSKRVLTLRRNSPRLHYLRKFGCDTIERKGGIEISLDGRRLPTNINEAHGYYAREHETLCRELTREIIEREGSDVLLETDAMSKHEFADRLKELP